MKVGHRDWRARHPQGLARYRCETKGRVGVGAVNGGGRGAVRELFSLPAMRTTGRSTFYRAAWTSHSETFVTLLPTTPAPATYSNKHPTSLWSSGFSPPPPTTTTTKRNDSSHSPHPPPRRQKKTNHTFSPTQPFSIDPSLHKRTRQIPSPPSPSPSSTTNKPDKSFRPPPPPSQPRTNPTNHSAPPPPPPSQPRTNPTNQTPIRPRSHATGVRWILRNAVSAVVLHTHTPPPLCMFMASSATSCQKRKYFSLHAVSCVNKACMSESAACSHLCEQGLLRYKASLGTRPV